MAADPERSQIRSRNRKDVQSRSARPAPGHAGVLQGAKEMSKSKFLYVTYIRTTSDKLWDALTNKELMKRYWFNMHQESDWREGSSCEMKDSKGEVWDSGTIVESQKPHKLVISWQHQHHAAARCW